MRRCPRFGGAGVEAIHAHDESVCYGPCEVHVMCDLFSGASQMTIKSSMVVFDVAMDNKGRAASLKPASATFVMAFDNILEVKSFANESSAPEGEAELDSGILVLLDSGQGKEYPLFPPLRFLPAFSQLISRTRELVACAIEGVHDDLCLHALHSAWQTQLLRQCARVPKCRDSDIDSATVKAYYSAVVQGLSAPQSVDSLVELLEEFSREVICNSVLKRLVFDTKEVLTCLVRLWSSLLDKQCFYHPCLMEDRAWRGFIPQERLRQSALYARVHHPVDTSVDLSSLDDDFNRYLLSLVAARLRLLGQVSQAMTSIFFGSELIPSRAEAVTSDDVSSPLGLTSWLRIGLDDVLQTLCDAMGLDAEASRSAAQAVAEAAMPSVQEPPGRGGRRAAGIISTSASRGSYWSSPAKVAPTPSPSPSPATSLQVDPEALAFLPQCKPPSPSPSPSPRNECVCVYLKERVCVRWQGCGRCRGDKRCWCGRSSAWSPPSAPSCYPSRATRWPRWPSTSHAAIVCPHSGHAPDCDAARHCPCPCRRRLPAAVGGDRRPVCTPHTASAVSPPTSPHSHTARAAPAI